MLWGSFGVVHILTLVLAVGILAGLYFLLKGQSDRVKIAVLGTLSFVGVIAVFVNLIVWGSPLEYLPFHLCSINALVLPFAVFSRNKTLNNLVLFWGLCALAAILFNGGQAHYEVFSWPFVLYYFPHLLEGGIPLLMFALKLVEKDARCLFSTLAITGAVYNVVHVINLAVNAYCLNAQIIGLSGQVVQVNYMYSLSPENSMFRIFYGVLPYPYWYMYVAVLAMTACLILVYSPQIYASVRRRRSAGNVRLQKKKDA